MDFAMGDESLLVSLQDDFNLGMPFDLSKYNDQLSFLCGAMGLSQYQALEAILVVGEDAEQCVSYCFQDDHSKLQAKNDAITKKGMALMTFDQVQDIMQELERLRREYRQVWLSRCNIETFNDDNERKVKLLCYQEFLRGVTITRYLSQRRLEKIEEYRRDKEITDDDHKESLLAIGISDDMYDKMKDSTTAPSRLACISCYERPKDHVMMDCLHLCLCRECADELTSKENAVCIVCKNNVRQVRRVYRS